jgi:peroxiredoxin
MKLSYALACWMMYSIASAVSAAPPAVGESARDFTLPNLEGKRIKLSVLTQQHRVVLVVLRGWVGYQCPACARQTGELIARASDVAKAQGQVVLIYPGPAPSLDLRAKEFLKNATLPPNVRIVLDPDMKMVEQYGLRWNAPKETAYPSTFVIGRDGVVAYALISKTHGGRPPIADVLAALDKAK